jgi:outer membrane biosynthesis protein TonB
MARPARPEPDLVSVDLEVSGPDAARIDQVLARPEFTGWTREQWCHEIIQTALRYYVGDAVSAPPKPQPAPEPPRPPQPELPEPEPPEPEPAPPEPEPPVAAERACAHPADARDYTTGTCAACGAILWD